MVWLYGQPYLSTEFVWDAGGGNICRTVVAPGLLAEVYEEGKVKRDGILMAQYGVL